MREPDKLDCFQLIAGLDADLHREGVDNYYVVGGLAAVALTELETEFDPASHTIVAAPKLSLPTERPNGTRRDLDVLVLSPDIERVAAARRVVAAKAAGQLAISAFGIDRHEAYLARRWRGLREWLSARTIDEQGQHHYVLGPVIQPVQTASYTPWSLITPDGEPLQVMHPAAQALCYRVRSISGVRVKDKPKLAQMEERIYQEPGLRHEVTAGPLLEWALFAAAIRQLNSADNRAYFPAANRSELFISRAKGRLLGLLEANERLVTLGQTGLIQKVLNIFVRAQS